MTDRVLITGFPKLLARRMALRLHAGGAHVALLVDEAHAPAARDFAQGAMEVLVGDASAMHLGLSTSEYRDLTSTVTDVLHAAEETTLGAPRDQMKRMNVSGTQAALELAVDAQKLRRFTHLSTVFVSGDRVGAIAEDELACGQAFRNAYEETKFEAELLVRRAMSQIPATVLRPSIVVGDSKTGEIDRFEGPYALAILLVTSPVQVPVPLPGDGVAPLNAVPIDYVIDAAAAIHADSRAIGRTFHLVDPNPSSARRVYELIAQRSGKKLPRMSLGYKLTDALLKLPGLERLTREQRAAIAYVNHLAFYSSRHTLEILDGTGIRCPPIESYLDNLIEFVRAEYRRNKE
jgi:thioester reductase-like protein